jgi:hypothetical protein
VLFTPDPYSDCETGIMNYLLAMMPEYFPQSYQVSANEQDKWRGGDYFLIFQPGAFQSAPTQKSHLIKDIAWTMKANLYVRFAEFETAWANYKAVRAAVIHYIDSNPALAFDQKTYVKNVQAVSVDGLNDPLYWQKTQSQPAPNFIFQTLRFVIVQRVTFGVNIVSK